MKRITILSSLLATCFVVAAQAQNATPKPDPALQKLHVIVGHWNYAGENQPGPLGPGGKYTGEFDIRMILGGFFVQCRDTEKTAMGESHSLEIWTYDPANKNFLTHGYADDGTTFSESFTFTGHTVPVAGTLFTGGKRYLTRMTQVWNEDWTSATMKEEISADGKAWVPWFEQTMTKVKPAAKK
jgi:hypothetical protein